MLWDIKISCFFCSIVWLNIKQTSFESLRLWKLLLHIICATFQRRQFHRRVLHWFSSDGYPLIWDKSTWSEGISFFLMTSTVAQATGHSLFTRTKMLTHDTWQLTLHQSCKSKVRVDLKNSGNLLYDRHKNQFRNKKNFRGMSWYCKFSSTLWFKLIFLSSIS